MELDETIETKCPQCRAKIQKLDGHNLLVKNAIIKVDLNTRYSYAKCPRCKIWVAVPLRFEKASHQLIEPHGGILINRVIGGEKAKETEAMARSLKKVSLNARCASDLELLATGAYSPLEGFMCRADYERVIKEMRLASGLPWTIPITLAIGKSEASSLKEGDYVALCTPSGVAVGLMHIEEIFDYDKNLEALNVYRTDDEKHPGVLYLYRRGQVLSGGKIELFKRIPLDGFERYKLDPAQTRALFQSRRWRTVVAFQTRNPIYRAHEYIQKCALELMDGLLVHPLVGKTSLDEIPSEVRIECYKTLLESYYPRDRVVLSIFPGAMRYAGPREALLHALVRKNYGCSHFIVGRDYACVGYYYERHEAKRIFEQFEPHEIGVTPLFFDEVFYCKGCGTMASEKTCPHDQDQRIDFSDLRIKEMLTTSQALPEELSRPEVTKILEEWAACENWSDLKTKAI